MSENPLMRLIFLTEENFQMSRLLRALIKLVTMEGHTQEEAHNMVVHNVRTVKSSNMEKLSWEEFQSYKETVVLFDSCNSVLDRLPRIGARRKALLQ